MPAKPTVNQRVAGSSPAGGAQIYMFREVASATFLFCQKYEMNRCICIN